MSEWWTYSLTDFLLFSPRTYYRLFELYNESLWPAQIAALVAAALIVLLLRQSSETAGRAIPAILALLWAWVAWAFHAERYATINWAAAYFAIAFVAQAALLLLAALKRDALGFTANPLTLSLFAFAVIGLPLVSAALRDWHQAEVFGLAPDPTAVATLAVLAAAQRPPWLLFVIPLLWCAVTGLTLTAMEAPDALVTPAAALLALLAAAWKTAAHETGRR
jgi:hypothetical protein